MPPSDNHSAHQPTPEEIGVRREAKACGGCTLCCTVLGIGPAGKAPGTPCPYVQAGQGCGIHPTRPDNCRAYQCVWTLADPLDITWRPDVAGFLLNPRPNPQEIEVVVDPANPDGWRREPYYSQLKQWSDPANPAVNRVLVRDGNRVTVVFPDAEIDLGPTNDPDFAVYAGYEVQGGRRAAVAHYVSRFGNRPSPVLIQPR